MKKWQGAVARCSALKEDLEAIYDLYDQDGRAKDYDIITRIMLKQCLEFADCCGCVVKKLTNSKDSEALFAREENEINELIRVIDDFILVFNRPNGLNITVIKGKE